MPGKYVSYETRKKLERPIAEMDEVKKTPHLYKDVPNKMDFDKNYDRRKAILDAATPPDTNDSEKDKLRKRRDLLTEALVKGNEKYVPPMPHNTEMQRPQTLTTDKELRWQNFWKKHNLDGSGNIIKIEHGGRGAIFEFKDICRILAKGYEDEAPNAANIEMIRPNGTGTSLPDTHLPVNYAFSESAKVHYEEVFPDHEPTDVEKKIEMSEVEKLKKKIDELESMMATGKKPRRKRAPRDLSDYEGPRCQAVKTDGSVCGQPVLEGKNHCFSKYHKKQLEDKANSAEEITEAAS